MSLVRWLRCTLPVLLLWPVLSSSLLLSMVRPTVRASITRGMACCSSSCEGCEKCELSASAAACALTRSGASTDCSLSAAPCHKPAVRTLTPFAWEPFMPSSSECDVIPADAWLFRGSEPTAPSSRVVPAPERPPAPRA